MPKYQKIAVVKEIESPENPGGLENRVALIPSDVAKIVATGAEVFVEYGAGEGVGFSDQEYLDAGAKLQSADEIYKNKDLILKFKGPAMQSISEMNPTTTLFCMAHFHSYPERAKLLQDSRINVIAMEEVLESPKSQTDEHILSRIAMAAAIEPFLGNNTIGALDIRVIGYSERLAGSVRRAGNRDPRSLEVLQADVRFDELDVTGENSLYYYDSKTFADPNDILNKLKATGSHLFDLAEYERLHGAAEIAKYRDSHPPYEFGLRRIQALHETGQAGARFGIKLLKENKPELDLRNAKAVVLGYGNVGRGAIHEIYDHGVKAIHVLGRTHTTKGHIKYWLKDADIIVNGAEQPAHLRGKNFLIKNEHLKEIIPDGSVVIDLVGGSETNRSPVEPVINCTFLTEPSFVQDGVSVAALWGWPMMGFMRETAIKYSGQITDVLINKEKLINGLEELKPNLKRALVCGPYYA